jgi:hypothetical protein
MKRCPFLATLLLFCCLPILSQAQEAEPSQDTPLPADSLDMDLEEPNAYDLILQRSLMLGDSDELTDIRNSSGNWFLGLGFKLPLIRHRMGFRIQPGIAWTKINYDSVQVAKTFPDLPEGPDYSFQRHRLTYAQLPIGIYYNFTLDEEKRARVFLEAGGYVGYRLSGVLKYGENGVRDQSITTKVTNVPDMKNLQYGLYGRLGYRMIAIYGQYRLSSLFTDFKTDLDGVATSTPNPAFPQFEIGISLLL